MAVLVIYSIPENTKCPPKPEDDIAGQVKTGNAFELWNDPGNPTPYVTQEKDKSTVYIYAKNSLKPGKCVWEPVDGGPMAAPVGASTSHYCVQYRCRTSSSLVRPLSGWYAAKRNDQNQSFPIEMSFKRNADFCLVCEILAPRAMDHAQAFLHTKPEPGNHGILHHPGDFMNQNAPLTEGFLQGTFVGPHGEKGTLRMILSLVPDANGMVKVRFGGFLSFAGIGDIETTFTSDKPVAWPTQAYA